MNTRPFPAAPIFTLIGHEPPREGEYPSLYQVGIPLVQGGPPIEQIDYHENYHGDHSLGWFDIHAVGRVIATVAARAVAEIRYKEEAQ